MPELVTCPACRYEFEIDAPAGDAWVKCPACGAKTLNLGAVVSGWAGVRIKQGVGVLLIIVSSLALTAGTCLFGLVMAIKSAPRANTDAWVMFVTGVWMVAWAGVLTAGILMARAGGQPGARLAGKTLLICGTLLVAGFGGVVFAVATGVGR
jgi:hypothetical protein